MSDIHPNKPVVVVDDVFAHDLRGVWQRFPVTRIDLARCAPNDYLAIGRAAAVLLRDKLSDGCPSEVAARRLRGNHPHVSVYVCAHASEAPQGRETQLAKSGVGRLFVLDEERGALELATTIERRLLAPAPMTVIWSLSRGVPLTETRIMAIECVLETFYNRHVRDIERRYGHDRKTLDKALAVAGLVGVGNLLRVGRLAHAMELISRGTKSRELVAQTLGFGSAKAMRQMWVRARKRGLVIGSGVNIARRSTIGYQSLESPL